MPRALRPHRPQTAAPRVHFAEKLERLDSNIREAREARENLASSRPSAQSSALLSRPQTASSVPWSQPRSKQSSVFSKPRTTEKLSGPKVQLADDRKLKPVVWFPGNVTALVDRDLEQVRLLTSRALGVEVDVCIVRCGRFRGAMAPTCRGARPLSLCAVSTSSRILGCYELTDGLGGIMFRRMTDTVCCELISTLGPFPAVVGRYEPVNTFMGSRVFPSGASIDSLSSYQPMVY